MYVGNYQQSGSLNSEYYDQQIPGHSHFGVSGDKNMNDVCHILAQMV
jgi:hypothetical protein